MFFHNFKYSLKVLFKNKALIFWTFAFPLLLATLFKMAFSNITSSEKLNLIDIAIVNDDNYKNNIMFSTAFNNLSDKNSKERLFNAKYVDEDEAKELLDKDKIVGYLYIEDNNPKIVINKNGINQTIFKYVSDEILETSILINDVTSTNDYDIKELYNKVLKILNNDNIKLENRSNSNLDYSVIEYYTLIAMTCMYGSMLGMFSINKSLANISKIGARVSISPTKKFVTVLSSLLAGYIAQLIGLLLLFLYTIFILKVDYGNNISLIILLAFVGSFAGLSLGIFLGSMLRCNENTKIGILIAFTMVGCFFAGMFGINEKYIIDSNVPIINKLNPVDMITDGFYSLYYYNTTSRFYNDIILLSIFSVLLISISFIGLRRQKYDSI